MVESDDFPEAPKWNFEMWFHMISWCWVHAPVIVSGSSKQQKIPGFSQPAAAGKPSHLINIGPLKNPPWKAPPISSCSHGVIAFFWLIVPKVSQGPLAFSTLQLSGFCLKSSTDRGKGKGLVGFFGGEGWDHVAHSLPLASNDRIHICCGTVFLKASHVFVGHPKKYTKHMVWAILPMSQEIFAGSLLQYFPASIRITWMEDRLMFWKNKTVFRIELTSKGIKIITKVWRV